MEELIGEGALTRSGLIAGVGRTVSDNVFSWSKIVDVAADNYNISLLGVISTFSNQNTALILLTCRRYQGQQAKVFCEKINNDRGSVTYSPIIRYKIEDGRIRVWCRGNAIFISRSTGYLIDIIEEEPESDAIDIDLS